MKHLKKLNAKGFAHWVIPALAIAVIGGIGSYILLRPSHADTLSTQAICGSGFKLEGTSEEDNPANPVAKVYFLANTSTKVLCAVTMSKNAAYGVSKPMSTALRIYNYDRTKVIASKAVSGTYKYYSYVKLGYSGITGDHIIYASGTTRYGGKTYSMYHGHAISQL